MDALRARFTTAEYFAGIGLLRMGLETCGWKVLFADDISPKKYEMYKGFFPDAADHYIVGDIFDLDPASVPPTLLATCSFPCIDLSLAGNMTGLCGKHSSAFWGFTRTLKAQAQLAPPLLLVENVPGWLSSNNGADFRTTVQALNQLGYACDVFTLDALSFTPQSRLRVFLIGTTLPMPRRGTRLTLGRPSALLSKRLSKVLLRNQDLEWFSAEIPAPPPRLTAGLSDMIEHMEDSDSRWWPPHEVERHLAMMAPSHYGMVRDLIEGDRTVYRTFFRRRRNGQQRVEVRRDDIAGCLRTAVGGSGKQFLIEAGTGRVRMRAMTPREYARLQGVADSYDIVTDGTQALTAFGDAVCVPVIAWIGRHVLRPLAERSGCTANA